MINSIIAALLFIAHIILEVMDLFFPQERFKTLCSELFKLFLVRFFKNILVKFEHDGLEPSDLIFGQLDLVFKARDSGNAPLIQVSQVVVHCKLAKILPNLLTFLLSHALLHIGLYLNYCRGVNGQHP